MLILTAQVDQVADHLADLPPPVEESSGQEWQYEIATVRAHIGRPTGRYILPFLLLELLPFLLLELIVADQLADLPPIRGT